MKRFAAFAFGITLACAPALALAQSTIPLGPTPLQMRTGAAQLQAQASALESGQTLACAAAFSTSTVTLGQEVDLGWGSVGALDPRFASTTRPMWTPQGASTLSFTQAGTWTYFFTFYSANNASTTCSAKIVVTK